MGKLLFLGTLLLTVACMVWHLAGRPDAVDDLEAAEAKLEEGRAKVEAVAHLVDPAAVPEWIRAAGLGMEESAEALDRAAPDCQAARQALEGSAARQRERAAAMDPTQLMGKVASMGPGQQQQFALQTAVTLYRAARRFLPSAKAFALACPDEAQAVGPLLR
ncbi:MAG TPA: hypothetical protein PK668_03305 [Myxococcota bacterium]|nr:hypothetical protein [Myxococcota bacterium]HRY91882.1 hypothetical protein [Myxococcota bacterium]HSA22225.1 hypothetical protein [Myxococcota bacterium]